ncbi:MAG: EAL domain-containing protein [Pseudomonadota bacterium]|nr:EAL domain-containing protein [Pseudomonadota bacterium]
MKLKFKIWLLLSALLSVVLAIDLAFSYQKLKAESRAESEYDARTVYGFMMATRRIYQQQFIASGLPVNEKTIGFLPAHSFSRISHDFANWNQSGIVFNNVTDRPRNPGNQADRFELEAMNWFRANPKASERMRDIVTDRGVGYMLYTAPIRIEPFCLKCHGERAAAPPSIRDGYATAYGYKVGDLRGVASIRIPTAKFQERLLQIWGGQLVKSLVGYAAIFLALGFILDRLVTRRLSRLQEGAQQIATGEYSARIKQSRTKNAQDEISGLAETFNRMADAVQNRAAEIHNLAYFDPLTGLPNRRLLMDRLNHVLVASNRTQAYGALMILDLDNFKTLNDTQGHDVGDQLLIEVARRLTANVRQEDTVSRLGGDEYVVILEGLGLDEKSAANQAEIIAEKVRFALIQPYALDGLEQMHQSTASIGMTLFHGLDDSTDVLLKQADVALYQAKDAGRNAVRFFNPAMQASIDTRIALENALRRALSQNELQLYYQPQVDEHGHIIGAEALLRWLRPGIGMVSPAQFIPLAEETGLILPIGLWVLHTACAQLKTWAGDAHTRDLQLAINVSAGQFHQADFATQIAACLAHSGIDPTRLKLELTESVVLDNVEEVISRMQEIKALGVSFSMDDFGTGYSSLSYLKRLPLDQIKIDQSFVRDLTVDPNDAAIVRAILAMSLSLGLQVIAEGVETQAQHDFLHANGCMAFQGYLFGKPMPIAEWEQRFPVG